MRNGEPLVGRYGPWALVAGGSAGLGAAFAEELARAGFSLVLVARREEVLGRTAARLRESYHVETREVPLDLAAVDCMVRLSRKTRGLEIGLLVCNAASSHTGPFLAADAKRYDEMLLTNCRAPLALIRACGERMAARGRGGIVVMTSLSALWGSPYVAVYGATKAFLLNLVEAVGEELAGSGVDVLACAAGPVRTPNYLASKPAEAGPSALEMEPAEVARVALASLGRRRLVVPGGLNRLAFAFMSRVLSRRRAVAMLGRSTRAMYGT
jgi:short-subunit dehydrogenase